MQHFEQELSQYKDLLLVMGSQAERSVKNAVKALLQRDDELAIDVESDDQIIDGLEMQVDDMGVALLSKAPLASDLRLITVAMKIAYDLERVGDEATTIARRTLGLGREPQLKEYVDLPVMAEKAITMLRDALHAFTGKDTQLARDVVLRDKAVDALNKQLHRELASYIAENPTTISRCLHLMVISKCLERIADHATNIAEEVVFLYEAKDIRHQAAYKGKVPAEPLSYKPKS